MRPFLRLSADQGIESLTDLDSKMSDEEGLAALIDWGATRRAPAVLDRANLSV